MFLQCRHELGVSGLKFLTFYVCHLWIFPLCKKANSNNDEVGRKIMARFNNKYRHLRQAICCFVEKTLQEATSLFALLTSQISSLSLDIWLTLQKSNRNAPKTDCLTSRPSQTNHVYHCQTLTDISEPQPHPWAPSPPCSVETNRSQSSETYAPNELPFWLYALWSFTEAARLWTIRITKIESQRVFFMKLQTAGRKCR